MPKPKTVTLSHTNMEQVKEEISSFFMQQGSPIHENTFINCTLEQALTQRTRFFIKRWRSGDTIRAKHIELVQNENPVMLRLCANSSSAMKGCDSTLNYRFAVGTTFLFRESKLFAKVPCIEYEGNSLDYVINVFGNH